MGDFIGDTSVEVVATAGGLVGVAIFTSVSSSPSSTLTLDTFSTFSPRLELNDREKKDVVSSRSFM